MNVFARPSSDVPMTENDVMMGLDVSVLPSNFIRRVIEDSSGAEEYRRIRSYREIETAPPNSSFCWWSFTGCCCCHIGTLIQEGTLGVMREDEDFKFLAPGYHVYPSCGRAMGEPLNLSEWNKALQYGTTGFLNVSEGNIGVLLVGSRCRIVAPGIYQWNSPQVKVSGVIPLRENVINLGPYTLLTVPEGNVAVTFNNGALRILGQEHGTSPNDTQVRRTYFLDDVKWTFSCLLPTVMQTDRLEGNDLMSKDNVEILMVAMSQWRIVDPVLAVLHCAPNMEAIRNKVNQLVRATIARIVAGTNIGSGPVSGSVAAKPIVTGTVVDAGARQSSASCAAAAAPAGPTATPQDADQMMQSEQATRHMAQLATQMAIMGIEVAGVFVPEKRLKNDDIRSQVARQAVIGIRAEAERASADATAYATVKAARAQAEAIEVVALAHAEAGRRLGEPSGTAARLALSENLTKALDNARVTIFSGAPASLPFMFGTEPFADQGAVSAREARRQRQEDPLALPIRADLETDS